MKYEWRKQDKALYIGKSTPDVIDVPAMHYLAVDGIGHPGSSMFTACVEALYGLSYGIKMTSKAKGRTEGYLDYTVFPLEGRWSLDPQGVEQYKAGYPIIELKDYFTYTLMIRQPDFLQLDLVEDIRSKIMAKKNNGKLAEVRFESIEEGKSIQMLHIGSYDLEPESFARMEAFARTQGLVRKGKDHKEIYLSDARRVPTNKLKTTLRFWLEEV